MPPNGQDASDVTVHVPDRPARIVSLVPSVTETLFALGLGERVVGVTDWCIHPRLELAGKTRVRGTKNPNVATIVGLEPDLVIANLEENRELDVRRMREQGLCVWVDFPCTVAEVATHVAWLAALGPRSEVSTRLVAELERASTAARPPSAARRCFLPVWKDPWMTISSATYAHDLLAHLGLENVFADSADRYPKVSLTDVRARDPEVILLPDEPYAFGEGDRTDLLRELGDTAAGRAGEIYVVDGTLAFWHGPRTVTALTQGLRPGAR